jgi:acetolactate synthase I/II/III large subunit
MSETRTGAQIMCEALIREGVEVLFGIPGGAIMPFYHALWEYRDKLRHVLCRHEQGAGHAAEGYARVSGKVGVCVATSGPGATNLVTPIAAAWMDSTPLVAVTGQVSSAVLGLDAFQEIDITGITMPITKHNYLVKNIEELPYVFKEAFHLASNGRPGPVLVDVCKDVQQARTTPNWNVEIDLPSHRPTYEVHDNPIEEAVKLLIDGKKPLIMAGHGVIIAAGNRELRDLAERTGIPVITTLHGIGAFPEDHPLSLGMPGMHGWVHVNHALQECDVLLNIGGRFDDRVTGKASTFAPHARIIHVDIDPSEIGKTVKVHVPIVGDAREVLEQMVAELPEVCTHPIAWLQHIRAMQAVQQPRQSYLKRPETDMLMPHEVYATLNSVLQQRGNFRVVTDVGQHQMLAAQLLDWREPRTHITSGGSGTMGFALPAALGVALACTQDTVWVICGDGGFQMTNQELATIQQEGIKNIKVAIINNGYLGMVRQWQQLFEGKRYSCTKLSGPDFARLAEAFGVRGMSVTQQQNLEQTVQEAWDHDGPVVIDFQVEQEHNVFPIVPQGKSIGEMMTEAPIAERSFLP